MGISKAVLTFKSGPNAGDTMSLEAGYCRLIGRHLSESETALIDRDGNRVLDGSAKEIISNHLKDRAPSLDSTGPKAFDPSTFSRGPDMIMSDNSVSRVHAMIFLDSEECGIIDLASTNGTRINGDEALSSHVRDGDILTIGNIDIEVKL